MEAAAPAGVVDLVRIAVEVTDWRDPDFVNAARVRCVDELAEFNGRRRHDRRSTPSVVIAGPAHPEMTPAVTCELPKLHGVGAR